MTRHPNISAAFSESVSRNRDRVAIETESESYTYGELDELAHRISKVIIAATGTKAQPIVLLLRQGVANVAATLAVLKSGNFYVPLDPNMHLPQLEAMASDCGSTVAICDDSTATIAETICHPATLILNLDSLPEEIESEQSISLRRSMSLTYIFYTSGSTGRCKGVFDCDRNVLHNIWRYTSTLKIAKDDRLSLIQFPSFSGTVSSMFAALLNGAVLLPFDLSRNAIGGLNDWVRRQEVTIFHSVPSIFRRLRLSSESHPRLRIIRLEGDLASPLDLEHFASNFSQPCRLVNGFGATECGIARQYFIDSFGRIPDESVPIGYPVDGMEVRIADEAGVEIPNGEIGEIVVRSKYLALGYWKRPQLSLSRFRPVPSQTEVRDYYSGDLGRMRDDGCIEYIARSDFQVKIHGRPVDTVALETALRNLESVQDARLLPWKDLHGDTQIVAYLVGCQNKLPTTRELRQSLAQFFDQHQIPRFFQALEEFPLTPDGKLDRLRLANPNRDRLNLMAPYASPQTVRESILVEVWKKAFSLDCIGILDSFTELGGDSLTGATIIWLAEDAGLQITMKQLNDNPTIKELAICAANTRNVIRQDVSPDAIVPLTPSQIRFLQRDSPEPNHWNLSARFESAGRLDPEKLRQALSNVIAMHDALRLRVEKRDNRYQQSVRTTTEKSVNIDAQLAFSYLDISGLQLPQVEPIILEKCQELQESLDLRSGPIIRLAQFRLADNDQFVLIAHHLIVDPMSLRTVIRDLSRAYESVSRGETYPPCKIGYSFQQYCKDLKRSSNSQEIIKIASRWSTMNWGEITELPRDYPASEDENRNATAMVLSYRRNVVGMLALAHNAGFATHEVLLTALHDAVSQWTNTNAVLLDILRYGRSIIPSMVNPFNIVGMFSYYMPIVLSNGSREPRDRLSAISGQLRKYWEHGWAFETVKNLADGDAYKESLHCFPRAKILFNFEGLSQPNNVTEPFRMCDGDFGNTHSPTGKRDHPLSVRVLMDQGVFEIRFVYCSKIHRRETIDVLGHNFCDKFIEMLDVCSR